MSVEATQLNHLGLQLASNAGLWLPGLLRCVHFLRQPLFASPEVLWTLHAQACEATLIATSLKNPSPWHQVPPRPPPAFYSTLFAYTTSLPLDQERWLIRLLRNCPWLRIRFRRSAPLRPS